MFDTTRHPVETHHQYKKRTSIYTGSSSSTQPPRNRGTRVRQGVTSSVPGPESVKEYQSPTRDHQFGSNTRVCQETPESHKESAVRFQNQSPSRSIRLPQGVTSSILVPESTKESPMQFQYQSLPRSTRVHKEPPVQFQV